MSSQFMLMKSMIDRGYSVEFSKGDDGFYYATAYHSSDLSPIECGSGKGLVAALVGLNEKFEAAQLQRAVDAVPDEREEIQPGDYRYYEPRH